MKVLEEKNCAICSSRFQPTRSWQLCCSKECTYERQKIMARWNKKTKPKVKKVKKLSLQELSVEARKHGMSYGKYIALVEKGIKL